MALMAALPIIMLRAERAAAPAEHPSGPGRAITIGKWLGTLGGAVQLAAVISASLLM